MQPATIRDNFLEEVICKPRPGGAQIDQGIKGKENAPGRNTVP